MNPQVLKVLAALAMNGDQQALQMLSAGPGAVMGQGQVGGAALSHALASQGQLVLPGRTSPWAHPGAHQLGAARGGPDNQRITERGIRGFYYDALENMWDQTWASKVGMLVPSDTLTETHAWMGQAPGMREWVGGLLAKALADYRITIENKDFESTLELSVHDKRRDKINNIPRKIGEHAMRAHNHWEELGVDMFETNPLAYDGVAFFSSAHVIGLSGTLSNDLDATDLPALNVGVATRPTREEAGKILAQAAAHFFTFKDDQGKKANQGARKFVILTSPTAWPAYQQAIADRLYITGGANDLDNLGWSFEAIPEPELASGLIDYMFRVDAPASKPLILQSEVDPYVDIIGPESEHAKKNNSELYILKATRNVGPGEWRQALRLTRN